MDFKILPPKPLYLKYPPLADRVYTGIGMYTNSAYRIYGILLFNRLLGVVVSSPTSRWKKGDWFNCPKYHLPKDIIPQWYREIKIKQ